MVPTGVILGLEVLGYLFNFVLSSFTLGSSGGSGRHCTRSALGVGMGGHGWNWRDKGVSL